MSKPEQLSSDRPELWDYIDELRVKNDALLAQNKLLVEALESSVSAFSCIRHNCPVDGMMLALDVSQQIVLQHINTSESLAKQALSKVKGEG